MFDLKGSKEGHGWSAVERDAVTRITVRVGLCDDLLFCFVPLHEDDSHTCFCAAVYLEQKLNMLLPLDMQCLYNRLQYICKAAEIPCLHSMAICFSSEHIPLQNQTQRSAEQLYRIF